MFVQRLRGLIQLHVVFTSGLALLLMAIYATALPFLPVSQLSEGVDLTPYYLCVAIGMVASGKFVQDLAHSFNRITWANAA